MDDELFESWKAGIQETFIQEIRRARHMLETAIDNIMKRQGNIQLSEFKELMSNDFDSMITEVIETFDAVQVEKRNKKS